MIKNILPGAFFVLATSCVFSANASTKLEDRMKLLQKLDMLDSLDFHENIDAANKCTKERDFECTKEKIEEAKKLAQSKADKKALAFAQMNLDEEVESVRLEQERIARQKALQEKMARIRREMEEAEEAERRRIAEAERERRREEENSGISFGQALALAGGAYVASQSSLSASDKAEFYTNYAADVMNAEDGGSMSNLKAWSEKKNNELESLRAEYRELELARAKEVQSRTSPNKYYQESLDRVKAYEDSLKQGTSVSYSAYQTNDSQQERVTKNTKTLDELRYDCEQKKGTFNAATRNCTIIKTYNTVVVNNIGVNRTYGDEPVSGDHGYTKRDSMSQQQQNNTDETAEINAGKNSVSEDEYIYDVKEARAIGFVYVNKKTGKEFWRGQGPVQRLSHDWSASDSEAEFLDSVGCENPRKTYHNLQISYRSGEELKYDKAFAYACDRPFAKHEQKRWDEYSTYNIKYPASVTFNKYECTSEVFLGHWTKYCK